jgi:hypothetical protein
VSDPVGRVVVRSADPAAAARALVDPQRQLVVAASPEAAHAAGLGPRTTSLARLGRAAARRHGRIAGTVTRRQALREACEAVFGAADAAGYAERASLPVATWLRAGLPSAPPDGVGERNLAWWRVAQRYRAALQARGAIDPVEAARLVGDAPPERTALALVGYPTLAADDVSLVDALAGSGSVVILPEHGAWTVASDAAAAALQARGWTIARRVDPGPDAVLEAWRAATLDDEVRAALAAVKRALLEDGVSSGEVIVVTRDLERYAGALRTVAHAYGLPLTLERRVALRATPLGGWVATLVDVVSDDLPFEATAALLRHPFCALLDQAGFDAARRWRPRGLAAWRRALTRTARGRDALAALDALTPFVARAPRAARQSFPSDAGAWRDALERVLEACLSPAAAAVHAPVLLAWRRALDDALPGAVSDAPARGAVLRSLRETLRIVSVPAGQGHDPSAAGVEAPVEPAVGVRVVAPEALAGARFERVFLLGAAEGMFPAPVQDPPLFDAFDRATLRSAGIVVESPADLARRERLAAWGVWRAAARLWLSYPEQIGRDARLPGLLFTALGVTPGPVARARPAGAAERRARDLARVDAVDAADDPVLRHARHAWHVELTRERASERDAYDGVVGRPLDASARRWSASQLTTFGQCRFRWLAQSAWGVREPREGEVEVSPLLRGSLYHHALALALQASVGRRGEAARAAAQGALESAFVAAERATDADAVPHWRHLRAEHLEHLRVLIDTPAFLPDDHEVFRLETGFGGTWHGLEVVGRVDRIDRTEDGVVVIDYKTGSGRPLGARGFDAERLDLDLQLPLYLEVAAPRLAPGERVASAQYLSLGAMREIPRDPPDPAEAADFVDRLRRSLAAGDYPVEPSDACRYCPLEAACRKGPRLEHKTGAPGGLAP